MARTRLTNPQPLVNLLYNPYQVAFLLARRLRACPGTCVDANHERLTWSMLDGVDCPRCKLRGIRPYRRFFLRAGRRGGKTRVGALSAIEEATIPYSVGWACAPSYPELEDYVLPAFFSQLPSAWFDHPATEWSEERLSLTLPNKAQVHFRSLDDPNRGTGPGLDWVWIDEGRKIQELAWDILRPALTEKKGIAFITSSPEWGEDWTHKRFWVPAEEGRPGFWATTYATIDNPIIDPAEIAEARATMPPELFRREYEASIEYPTGTIYGDHLSQCDCSDDEIKAWIPEWPRIDPSRPSLFAIDPGTDHPFAGCLIVVTPKGLVVAGEYRERNKPFFLHAQGIRNVVGALQPRFGIDKSASQAAIELSQHGIFAAGAENAVAAGIQRVYAWMATGKLRIARSRCPKLLAELKQYRWAEAKETLKGLPADASPFKKGDDLCDALRYAVMLWPELPSRGIADPPAPGERDLALMKPEYVEIIKRNLTKAENDEGLVRVTDSFDQVYDEMSPAGHEGLADFYR